MEASDEAPASSASGASEWWHALRKSHEIAMTPEVPRCTNPTSPTALASSNVLKRVSESPLALARSKVHGEATEVLDANPRAAFDAIGDHKRGDAAAA
jgi:hypothetical protein